MEDGVLARPFPGVLSLFPNLIKENVLRLNCGRSFSMTRRLTRALYPP